MFFKDVFVLVSRGTHCMTLAEQQHEQKSKEKFFNFYGHRVSWKVVKRGVAGPILLTLVL